RHSPLQRRRDHRAGSCRRSKRSGSGQQQLSGWRCPLSHRPRQSANPHRSPHHPMTLRTSSKLCGSGFTPLPVVLLFAVLVVTSGCSKKDQEVTPEVSVQVTPARTGEISQLVTAEAVVFPLQQAVVAPKITSTIKSFSVQRGARVHKGQLLAVLENA